MRCADAVGCCFGLAEISDTPTDGETILEEFGGFVVKSLRQVSEVGHSEKMNRSL